MTIKNGVARRNFNPRWAHDYTCEPQASFGQFLRNRTMIGGVQVGEFYDGEGDFVSFAHRHRRNGTCPLLDDQKSLPGKQRDH
jgi:hypothetical protein